MRPRRSPAAACLPRTPPRPSRTPGNRATDARLPLSLTTAWGGTRMTSTVSARVLRPRARGSSLGKLLADDKLATIALFLPPALLLYTLFVILPIGEAGWYSAFNWNGFGSPTNWVG